MRYRITPGEIPSVCHVDSVDPHPVTLVHMPRRTITSRSPWDVKATDHPRLPRAVIHEVNRYFEPLFRILANERHDALQKLSPVEVESEPFGLSQDLTHPSLA